LTLADLHSHKYSGNDVNSRIDIVVAVNDDATLERNLLASQMVGSGAISVHQQHGAKSAAAAYNAGLDATQGDIVIFAHQDVYFPPGWDMRLRQAIAQVESADPNWALIGPTGVCAQGRHFGRVWSSSQNALVGEVAPSPVPAQSFDELALVLRRSSGLRFDEGLPGFHMFGTDMAQSALAAGQGAYICELPLVHNDRFHDLLRGDFRDAFGYVRRKWRHRLPLRTTVLDVSGTGLDLSIHRIKSWKSIGKRRKESGDHSSDPRLYSARCGWEEISDAPAQDTADDSRDTIECARQAGNEDFA
jgi:glycosyltransferase involved in cell wall biosynthesis